MSDLGYSETVFDHYRGSDYWGVSTGEKKWKNKLAKLEKQCPGEVVCIAKNDEGGVYYHIPERFLTIRKPKTVNMTEERRAELAARCAEMRKSK